MDILQKCWPPRRLERTLCHSRAGPLSVARWRAWVLRFSVGFGRDLGATVRRGWHRMGDFGGAAGRYVKMTDEREGDVAPVDPPRAFNP
jgi:hypothetical protein